MKTTILLACLLLIPALSQAQDKPMRPRFYMRYINFKVDDETCEILLETSKGQFASWYDGIDYWAPPNKYELVYNSWDLPTRQRQQVRIIYKDKPREPDVTLANPRENYYIP